VSVQVGYSIADVLAKAAFGIFIYTIALRKSEAELAWRRPESESVGRKSEVESYA
jgi:hypothetical protein